MYLNWCQHEDLPKKAWVLDVISDGNAKILSGTGFHEFGGGFFEGSVGEIPGCLLKMSRVFGSGFVLKDDVFTLITPAHTLESLYVYRRKHGWMASNSLALLVSHANLQLPWSPRWGIQFASLCSGITNYQQKLIQTPNGELFRFAFHNVTIDAGGDFQTLPKPCSPAFTSFEQYRDYLQETIVCAFEGTGNPKPIPATTCSTGYDSACCAALAWQAGCRRVLTLCKARGGDSDSGRPIGELLDMNVIEVERPERANGALADLAPFLATGMGGEDYCYSGFAPHLANNVLLSGFHGDKIWEVGIKPNNYISRGDLSGSSLQEFRLWTDFIHIPVPMIGALQHAEIAAINNSPDMQPWRLNNHYDRPIARRIVEDAGVLREMFGQTKKAASLLLFTNPKLIDLHIRNEMLSAVPADWRKASERLFPLFNWETRSTAYKICRKLGLDVLESPLVNDWRVFEHNHPQAILAFGAGLYAMTAKYRSILALI